MNAEHAQPQPPLWERFDTNDTQETEAAYNAYVDHLIVKREAENRDPDFRRQPLDPREAERIVRDHFAAVAPEKFLRINALINGDRLTPDILAYSEVERRRRLRQAGVPEEEIPLREYTGELVDPPPPKVPETNI